MKKPHLTLTAEDRQSLQDMLSKGSLPARTFKRAMALLELDRGKGLVEVAKSLGVTYASVSTWRNLYRDKGLSVLHDAPRSGRPPQIDGLQRAQITALACSTPPQGHAQWSLRLLADKVVEAGFCDTISHVTVGEILKKTP